MNNNMGGWSGLADNGLAWFRLRLPRSLQPRYARHQLGGQGSGGRAVYLFLFLFLFIVYSFYCPYLYQYSVYLSGDGADQQD